MRRTEEPEKQPDWNRWAKRLKNKKVKHPTEYRGYLIVPIKKEYRLYDRFNRYVRKFDMKDAAPVYRLVNQLIINKQL